MIYLVFSWWWTVFIFMAVWAVVIAIIVLINKGKIDFNKVKPFINKLKKMKKAPTSGCAGCSGCAMRDTCSSYKKDN